MKRGPAGVRKASSRERTTSGAPGSIATQAASAAGVPRNVAEPAHVPVEDEPRHPGRRLHDADARLPQRVPLRARHEVRADEAGHGLAGEGDSLAPEGLAQALGLLARGGRVFLEEPVIARRPRPANA